MATKLIGGTNGMHLMPERHPFQDGSGKNIKPKLAHMKGITPPPGGDGDKISANAQMKKKRPLDGPGDVK